MKNRSIKYNLCYFALIAVCGLLISTACSDVTQRQRDYLDQGENIYVGKMDSVEVRGGWHRVTVVGQNTFLRTAEKCNITWFDDDGKIQERTFNIADVTEDNNSYMVIEELEEGDYQFSVQTEDDLGNKSLSVSCFGTAYGDRYKQQQSKITVLEISIEDDGSTQFALSRSIRANKMEFTYQAVDGTTKTYTNNGDQTSISIADFEAKDNVKLKIVTYIMPTDKLGTDIIKLDPMDQTVVEKGKVEYPVDKMKIKYLGLTKYDDKGDDFGQAGAAAIFDGDNGRQSWGHDPSAPGHMTFDLGKATWLTGASIVGRKGYPGWDLVKFEIWGRESLDDGPDGPTGYNIQSKGGDPGFEKEALLRKWKKVGKGWFKYIIPRNDPQTSQCELTTVDHSFKPRYMMLRTMSVLTPNLVPVPDQYTGAEGGFSTLDSLGGARCFNIGEMSLRATGIVYAIK